MKPNYLVPHKEHKGMYYLAWEDGSLSYDFYNLTRAHDILKNYADYRNNMEKRGKIVGKHSDCIDREGRTEVLEEKMMPGSSPC